MFNCYVGLRGCGKSSHAAKIVRMYVRKKRKVFSNVPIKGAYLIEYEDIGKFDISNGVLIFDEAGIDANSRAYKSFTKEAIKWWKLSRHYGVNDIYVYSQAFDFDITLRRLSDNMHIIKKGLFGFSNVYKLKQHWDNNTDGQPIIKYEIPILFSPFFRPLYYKYFDSFSCPKLPFKDYPLV